MSRLLSELGWQDDEPWTPFHHDLSGPMGEVGVRVEAIELDRADIWAPVHRSAFRGLPFTEENRLDCIDWWVTMATGPLHDEARSLAAFDADGQAVAVATVWSAGAGRPGLLEPVGVHRNHRGHGYGVAITRAAASALREMGSSSAVVCAESSNVGAASTYVSAGFTAHQQVTDLHRDA